MFSSFLRVLSSFAFLSFIVFTIPLTFDVGGRTSGLAFSLSLFVFYCIHSFLRLVTPSESRFRLGLVRFVGSLQWLVIPALMIWALNRYSVDSNSRGNWVERTFDNIGTTGPTVKEWIAGQNNWFENFTIGTWDKVLQWSIPACQLAEGFCSLLVIQSCGQITKYLVNKENGDNWMIGLLVVSASVSSTAVYFLYRVTTFPEIDNIDAILMGSAITFGIMLCGWGIGSGRGNPVESSLLFAYLTLCIYQIFTDYRPSNPVSANDLPNPQPEFPPFPPIIMASYSTLMHILSSLPTTIHSAFGFLVAVVMTITPSVIISLAYRVFVMYASTRIIPAVRESGARALSQEPSLDDNDELGQVLGLASYFSPSILITVYTSLLMQHFASISGNSGGEDWWTNQGGAGGGNISRWANLAITMLLYAIELHLGRDDHDSLTTHWKVD